MKKRTKALSIRPGVKKTVWDRDKQCCIFCGSHYANPEAHALYSRAQGGLGIEQNIITVCRPCHMKYDSGNYDTRIKMKTFAREYLENIYGAIDDESLVYKKWSRL